MNSKELLEQARERAKNITGLELVITTIEELIPEAEIGHITINDCGIYEFLDEADAEEIKLFILDELRYVNKQKIAELEILLGIRKPATINPEFEKVIEEKVKPPFKADHIVKIDGIPKYIDKEPEKEEPPKCEPRSPLNELEVDNVRRMYHDEAKTMKEIAEYYGVTKTRMNSYISKYNLRRTSYKKGFLDPVDKPKPEPLRAQSNVKKCRVCGKNIIINSKMAWGHKYERKQNGKVETAYCCSRECLGIGKMKDV